ncbi:MAG: PhoH family protein [Magnetococcales bacterium]|nr:PhoH family protein [Magnetococcales bacterium]
MDELKSEKVGEDSLVLELADNQFAATLFGEGDCHLRQIEKGLKVTIHSRGNGVVITADKERALQAKQLLEQLYQLLEKGDSVDLPQVEAGIQGVQDGRSLNELFSEMVVLRAPRCTIHPRNPHQADYIRTLLSSVLTIASGPAGTGKTYLAVAAAVTALIGGAVERIVLTRPAVEAGERLGFLPGDLHAKVDPYLRPLYDALNDMLGAEKVEKMLLKGSLEIVPLAYMRGRTLEDAYIILDEAQNATVQQMKMFLTRFGNGSQVVVSGDITQIDLPRGTTSGLVQAIDYLKDVKGISFIKFSEKDVVRHPLVRRIVRAYERAEKQSEMAKKS